MTMAFDRLVDEAWPATYVENVGGWRLRFADGVTKRANSVWPAAEPGGIDGAITAVEHFYAERGLPAVFSLSAEARPEGLDGLLAARGYEIVDPTLIMTAELPGEAVRDVEIADVPSAEWLDLWWLVDGRYGLGLGTATDIMTGVPAWYASTGDAVGRGVPQGDWMGIYCMAVAPHARRRGLARNVLHALLGLGREHGARKAYLSVTAHNTAARALYASAGFEVAGGYHYRVRHRMAGGSGHRDVTPR
ncbi:MAG: GNAT family N-acetyltransferase [Actinomadura sp.]